jgi:ABC-type proline/glycine betaine transport system permease subunit
MTGAVAGSKRRLPVAATVAVLFTALVLVPVLWGISTSFKNEVDAVQVPPQLLPTPATASNYIQVLSNPNFLTQLGNSVLYSVGSVLLALAVSIAAGYAASRFTFRAKGPLMLVILATSMVPSVALLVPTYVMLQQIGLLGGSMFSALRQPRWLLGACVAATIFTCVSARAQPTEIVYSTFLDPANTRDPRAAAQTKMIAAFEKANPNITVKLLVDPTVQNVARALKSHDSTPDVLRTTGYSVAEMAATGAMLPLEDLIARDNLSTTDWLLPLDANRIGGHLYSLPQDYRIPILIYRSAPRGRVSPVEGGSTQRVVDCSGS